MKTKNTRLVYTDEKNLKAYASLPAEDFKEFFMTYLTYQDGDEVSKTISNPFVQTLFMAAYADKITHNEKKWEDAAEKRRENGKKGGRPKKNNDIAPNEEFENTMTIGFPTKIEERQTDTKDVAKAEIEAQNADLNDNFDDYSERLYNLIDDNITKIRQSTDILAQKQIEIGSQMDNTVAFHRNVLYDLRQRLGWDTKDGIDFQQFIDEEINRKAAQIRYERAI